MGKRKFVMGKKKNRIVAEKKVRIATKVCTYIVYKLKIQGNG